MATTNWKDIAELIGIAAIVASLMFVGLEMRQSHQLALAEQQGEQIGQAHLVHELLIAHSDIVLKLNNGQSLTDEEQFIANQLITTIRSNFFFRYRRWDLLDHPAIGAPARALASILNQNPGLRSLWTAHIDQLSSEVAAVQLENRARPIMEFHDMVELALERMQTK